MSKQTKPASEPHLRFAVLAADVALFTIHDNRLLVRLMMVNRPPHFNNIPALPGGLLTPQEIAEETAVRIVKERATITSKPVYLEQLATFSGLDRDPRGRVVAVAYLGAVPFESLTTSEQLIGEGASFWCPVKDVKALAYDHDEILSVALTRLRSRVQYTTLIAKLLPKEFTLTELERAYECILNSTLDKRNFRKKILKLGVLTATGKKRADGAFRPAELYRFTSNKVEQIEIL